MTNPPISNNSRPLTGAQVHLSHTFASASGATSSSCCSLSSSSSLSSLSSTYSSSCSLVECSNENEHAQPLPTLDQSLGCKTPPQVPPLPLSVLGSGRDHGTKHISRTCAASISSPFSAPSTATVPASPNSSEKSCCYSSPEIHSPSRSSKPTSPLWSPRLGVASNHDVGPINIRHRTGFSSEQIFNLHKRFDFLGPDRDGKLHLEDLIVRPDVSRDPLFPRMVDVMIKQMETPSINFLQFIECLSVFNPTAPSEMKMRFLFDVYDISEDGIIDVWDLVDIGKRMAQTDATEEEIVRAAQTTLDELDIGHKGHLTYDDFRLGILSSQFNLRHILSMDF